MYLTLFVSFLFLLTNIISESLTQDLLCGENEVYQKCGSWCPTTCYDFSYPKPHLQSCIDSCKTGCFCQQGYYRANNGQCVLPEKCCQGSNEHYTDCGSACIETCDNTPNLCIHKCVPGCFCESSDYIRESNKTGSSCIKRNKCPKTKRNRIDK